LESSYLLEAIVRNILSDKRTKKKSKIGKLVPSGEKIKSKALAEAVRKKDKIVLEHLKNACDVIGVVSANVSNLLNVDMIVYGGGLMDVSANVSNLLNVDMIVYGGGLMEALGDAMLPMIKTSYYKNVLSDAAKGTKLVKSKLGDDAAIYGGIALAEEFLGVKV